MKFKVFWIPVSFSFVALVAASVHAGSDGDSIMEALKEATLENAALMKRGAASGITSLTLSFAAKVSNPQQRIAIETYKEVVRPQDYANDDVAHSQNVGVVNYFADAMSGDGCFRELVKQFYSDEKNVSYVQRPIPKIKSQISDLKDPQYKPGWLWEKALKLTGGNPNMALKIIAYCGHDDVEQTEDKSIFCPGKNSPMYYPEALGKGVETSDSVKDLVIRTQSIHASAENIKAKNYHILLSAYLGCQMIENGVKPESAADFSQKFAYVYRRIRTCRVAFNNYERYKDAEARYEKALGRFTRSQSDGKRPSIEEEIRKDAKTNFDSYKYQATQDKEKFLKSLADTYYASKLYVKMTQCPDGKANEVSEAIKANSASGIRLGSDSLYLPLNFDEQCPSIAGGRCVDAKKVLDTWDADFKWTMNQHRVGAEFAAKNCKPLSQQKTPPLCAKSATGAGGGASATGTR
jgi:hypothetical protein